MLSVREVEEAADQLAQSHRGRNALTKLLDWLEDDGLGLDASNQAAIYVVLQAAWGKYSGTTREIMRDAIAAPAVSPAKTGNEK